MTMKQPISETPEFKYANFILRLGAFVIDVLILGVILSFLRMILINTLSLDLRMENFLSDDLEYIFTPFLTMSFLIFTFGQLIVFWLYYALTESRLGASPGKLLFKLTVTDINGHRIDFKRATGHTFARILSFVPFLTGYLMAAFTDKKQALHDLLSGCIVIPTREVVVESIQTEVDAEEVL
jgi:uncharacterized RDD family membrane protein YckC